MHITSKGLKAAFVALLLPLLSIAPATALDFANAAYIQTADGNTSIPVGHAEFCKTRPGECQPNANPVSAISLDDTHWNQMLQVNAHFNSNIMPVTDADLYQIDEFWTYPNGYGDCEDYALAKRRALIDAGWPASTLLLAVVREANGNGHAVLLVRTDRGDLVLDNQDGMIRLWNETPYQFIKRQDQADAGRWVEMIDDRSVSVTATASAN